MWWDNKMCGFYKIQKRLVYNILVYVFGFVFKCV